MSLFSSPTLRCVLLAVASLAVGVCASDARPNPIEDNASFFSEGAKADASRTIADLVQREKKEVVVETEKELPADVRQGLNLEDKAAVNKAVGQWAAKEAKAKQVNGVFVLIVKNPAHLQVEVGNKTQERAFTLKDRDELVSSMLTRFRSKQYDDALREGVNFVASTMRANAPNASSSSSSRRNDSIIPVEVPNRTGGGAVPQAAAAPAEHHWGLMTIIIGVIVLFIIFRILRGLFRGGSGGSYPGGYGGGGGMMPPSSGGGGFFSSLVGGIFGAAAGNWIYDQFSGRRDSTPSTFNSQPEYRPPQQDDQGYSGKDTDYSGGGGSFDDSGSGNSGDSGGGGDFGGGGGDSGGNDDSGSGGGDF